MHWRVASSRMPRTERIRMKRIFLVLALFLAVGAAAQPTGGPTIGPGPSSVPAQPGGRSDLWQLLTPEQREQLWRSLTPEQRADVWRGLQPQERREMRGRLGPGAVHGASGPWGGRSPNADNRAKGWTMTPEERQQMREQIREAHRQRRERLEAERARRSP